MGGRLPRFHRRDRAGQYRALGLGQYRQAIGRIAGAARRRSRMAWRTLLGQGGVQDRVDRHPGRDLEALRHRDRPGAAFPRPGGARGGDPRAGRNWAAKWDANSLIILRRALLGFDTRPDFARIKAKVLYILCRTDALFPPKIAPDVIKALTAAGVEARYFELDSDLGHSSSGPEHAKWSPVLREFLAPLVARLN